MVKCKSATVAHQIVYICLETGDEKKKRGQGGAQREKKESYKKHCSYMVLVYLGIRGLSKLGIHRANPFSPESLTFQAIGLCPISK